MTRLSRFAFPRATVLAFVLLAVVLLGVGIFADSVPAAAAGEDALIATGGEAHGLRALLQLCVGG